MFRLFKGESEDLNRGIGYTRTFLVPQLSIILSQVGRQTNTRMTHIDMSHYLNQYDTLAGLELNVSLMRCVHRLKQERRSSSALFTKLKYRRSSNISNYNTSRFNHAWVASLKYRDCIRWTGYAAGNLCLVSQVYEMARILAYFEGHAGYKTSMSAKLLGFIA